MAVSSASEQRRPLRHAASGAIVEYWLWLVAAIVFAMIVVGGATRLTDSGLSITEWQPLLGAIPPLSDGDWLAAFEKYRQIPEYHLVNRGMSLEAFKAIYWWEWSHRFLGRFIGVVFALPLAVFWLTGRLRRGTGLRYMGVLALGGLQGAIGWYMVKSGLVDRVDVSQYRLALHLTTAFTIFALLIWFALAERQARCLAPPREAASPTARNLALVLLAALATQIVLGAFVAGLKAGLVYNTWPDMNGALIPEPFWPLSPWYLNLFEDHATVQFSHRMTAYLIMGIACWLAIASLRRGEPRNVRMTAYAVVAGVFAQAALGVWTLLSQVPLALGLAHQAGAAALLGLTVAHVHAVFNRDPAST